MSAPAAYAGFLDFYRRGPYAPFLQEHRSGGAASAHLLRLAQPAGRYGNPASPDVTVRLLTHGSMCGSFDQGAGRWAGRFVPGHATVSPAGTASDWTLDGPFESTVVAIPASGFAGAPVRSSAGSAADLGPLHAAPVRDPFVEALCRRLWDEAVQGNPYGALFADGAVLALAAALLRLARPAAPGPVPRDGRRLRRAFDLVEARLAEDLSLADLAGATALSPRQTLRAFRAATGSAPHAYLQARRVERAKELLARTDLPLAEVALACGFKNQSHFGQAFRRSTGATPGAYRRERRP